MHTYSTLFLRYHNYKTETNPSKQAGFFRNPKVDRGKIKKQIIEYLELQEKHQERLKQQQEEYNPRIKYC